MFGFGLQTFWFRFWFCCTSLVLHKYGNFHFHRETDGQNRSIAGPKRLVAELRFDFEPE